VPSRWWVGEVVPAGQVVLEEYLADQLTAAANACLVEDGLEVVLHGVGREPEPVGHLLGGAALDAQVGHRALAIGQPVGQRDQRGNLARLRGLDDYRDAPRFGKIFRARKPLPTSSIWLIWVLDPPVRKRWRNRDFISSNS
jgi:hypothetical protein